MATMDDGSAWSAEFAALLARLGPRFGRVEPRRRAATYLKGLLAPVERKNGWQLAAAAGDRTPDGVQEFLSRVHWDADAVRDDLRTYVVEHLGDPGGVLVLDETGFVKKGSKSAGVQRQYSGTAGRIENCQIGVFLAYASRYGRTLIDRALYLPESWAADRARRAEAGVPEDVAFATKPKLGLAMLERAHAAGLPFAWVTADSVYGADHALRRWLQAHSLGYVLAVTRAQRLGFARVEDRVAEVPAAAWHRLSAGDGAKGPRLYDWAYVAYGSDAAPGWEKGLLIRRSLAAPRELAFYLTYASDGTALSDLVKVAGTRWMIEACFEAAKGEVGLDQYEVRSWNGCLPRCAAQGRRRGTSPRPTWRPTCSRSPSRNCAACSGTSSGPTCPISRPSSPGHVGGGATSNAPAAATGSVEPPLKPGCSTFTLSVDSRSWRGSWRIRRVGRGRAGGRWRSTGRRRSVRRPCAVGP
jgi:SRSO17 transposase